MVVVVVAGMFMFVVEMLVVVVIGMAVVGADSETQKPHSKKTLVAESPGTLRLAIQVRLVFVAMPPRAPVQLPK